MRVQNPWRIVASRDAAGLTRLLTGEEPVTTVMSERFLRHPLDRRLRRGGRFLLREPHSVVYQGPGGFFFPFCIKGTASSRTDPDPDDLDPDAPDREAPDHGDRADTLRNDRLLRRRIGSFSKVRTIMGTTDDVEALNRVLGVAPGQSVDYDLLRLDVAEYPPLHPPPVTGLTVRRMNSDDWRLLLDLQIAYEQEEVLLPGNVPVPSHSKAHLLDSLSRQLVLAAMYQGEVIGRVATNARGFHTDQVGGVFTVPSWRDRGVARWLMTHLLYLLGQEQRHATLFVKHSNTAARQLYRGLNFRFESLFRISYYP
jgi:uncharacterized protein